MCKFYTERIALASSSKELHQIVNTLSNRHPPKILPTIYPSADLPSIFIKHFTNKAEKLRANIASEHVTSTLVTGTTAATFSSFEKVSQLKVKECILISAPKSCELDPIHSKLLIEILDCILPSLTDLFNSSLASGIFQQCFKSALVTPFLKKRCLDHNDLMNYRPVSNLYFIAKMLEKLVLSQVSSYLNTHNLYNTCQSAYRPGHSTETALLKVVNDLFLSLNKGNISVLTLLDSSSALGTIDHTILVHRTCQIYACHTLYIGETAQPLLHCFRQQAARGPQSNHLVWPSPTRRYLSSFFVLLCLFVFVDQLASWNSAGTLP